MNVNVSMNMKREVQNHGSNVAGVPRVRDEDIARVAREEGVSPGSVVRALLGLRVRGLAGERARRAVARLTNGKAA